jgi:hypothetical protein
MTNIIAGAINNLYTYTVGDCKGDPQTGDPCRKGPTDDETQQCLDLLQVEYKEVEYGNFCSNLYNLQKGLQKLGDKKADAVHAALAHNQ